jgi:hypothetical protein
MSIKKHYLTNHDKCRITFSLKEEIKSIELMSNGFRRDHLNSLSSSTLFFTEEVTNYHTINFNK